MALTVMTAAPVKGLSLARNAQRSTFAGVRVAQKAMVTRKQQSMIVRAEATEVDSEAIIKDLQDKWDKVENKTGFIVYTVGGFTLVWLSSTILGALNGVPLLPRVFELVGLGYSAWFTYRYLLFKSSREELVQDIEALKKKIGGDN